LFTLWSARGYSTDPGSLVVDKGKPRYLIEKFTFWHGKKVVARLVYSSEQRIGAI
jgi:hypothetical protein